MSPIIQSVFYVAVTVLLCLFGLYAYGFVAAFATDDGGELLETSILKTWKAGAICLAISAVCLIIGV